MCSGVDNAAASNDNRTFCRRNCPDQLIQLKLVRNRARVIAAEVNSLILHWCEQHLCSRHILRNIDQYRSLASGIGNVEGFVNDPRQILYIPYQIAMLRNRHRYTRNVRFLEGIRTNQAGEDVPGNNNQGHRVHKSSSDTSNEVRCSRTRSRDTDTGLAACSGITVSRMNCALLVAGQNMFEIIETVQSIVNVQNRSARITEYCIYAFQNQTAQQDFRTRNHLGIFPFLT
ncbi:hypothetical protein D3C73_1078950 [compost metagenome]